MASESLGDDEIQQLWENGALHNPMHHSLKVVVFHHLLEIRKLEI